MKIFLCGLALVGLSVPVAHAQPGGGFASAEQGRQVAEQWSRQMAEALQAREFKMQALAAEHPIQPSDISNAALKSLEQSLSAATAQHDLAGLTTCLELLERFWSQAVALHHADAIDQIEADDFVGTDLGGALTHKADDLEAARSGALQLVDYRLEDIKVNLYGDAAVLTGKTVFRGTAHDQPFSGSYRWTDVFVQRGVRWQVVASQATTIAPSTEIEVEPPVATPIPSPMNLNP